MNHRDSTALDAVRAETSQRTWTSFSHDDARALGLAVLEIADRDELAVTVSVRRGDQVAFHAARVGTTAELDGWVQRKINTALLHEIPSHEFVLRQRVGGFEPVWLDPVRYAVAGGAIPIVVGGVIAGVIGVAGLLAPESADHDLAMAAVRAVASRRALLPAPPR